MLFFIYMLLCSGVSSGGGHSIIPNDIGGAYAAIVYSISNTAANLSGIVAPYFVAVVTPNVTQWLDIRTS